MDKIREVAQEQEKNTLNTHIKVWNLVSGEEKLAIDINYKVNSVAVTQDGNFAIFASADNTLKVWDLFSREEKFILKGHSGSINAVAVTPDTKLAVSASNDNTLKVWDLFSRREIATFAGESEIKCCAIAPDNLTIVAGEVSGRLHFLRLQGAEVQS